MAVPLVVNGVTYSFPQQGDTGYAGQVTSWAQAITNGTLQLGGTYALASDLIFTGFGVKAPYFTSGTANPATAGAVRLAKTDAVDWRNNANGANLALGLTNLGGTNGDNLAWTDAASAVTLITGRAYAEYRTTAAPTMTNAVYTIVDYSTSVTDTDSAVTTGASWHFTVPTGKGGRYFVGATVRFAALTANTGVLSMVIEKNGAIVYTGTTLDASNGATSSLLVSTLIACAPGDTLDARVFNGQAAGRALTATAAENRITIEGPF